MPSLHRDRYAFVLDERNASSEINRVRDLIEGSPILVGDTLVDVDQKAERRFRNTIEQWDSLGINSIEWTMADNTNQLLDKQSLIELFDAAAFAATARGAAIHVEALAFKADNTTTMRQLVDWAKSYNVTI